MFLKNTFSKQINKQNPEKKPTNPQWDKWDFSTLYSLISRASQ